MKIKQAVIMAFMGKTRDRFCEYQQDRTPLEKIEAIAEVKGAQGVEIVFPYELEQQDKVIEALTKHELGIAAVNVNIKAEPEFAGGSASLSEESIRKKAVQYIKDGMDMAAEMGADKVTCCPLSDGYDYLFQENYLQAWQNMIFTFREAACHRRDVRLFIEYKASEPRVQCYLDTAAKTVCMINAINEPNVGMTMDIGHSLMANETPAEAVCLAEFNQIPYYIHINDNNRRWDWDLIPATRNFWDYLELLYYLKEFNYDGWVTSDMSPTRLDARAAFERTIATTNKLIGLVNQLDSAKLNSLMTEGKTIETLQWLEEQIIK